jgi:hypothetical protein
MRFRLPILLLLAAAGCQKGTVAGLSLSLGSYERGLWYDHDDAQYHPGGFGLKFDIVAGEMIRPVPKFWESGSNPWKGDEPWFVIQGPMIGPFLSLSLGEFGMYIGFKTFQVGQGERSPEKYGRWMRQEDFPEPNDVYTYVQPSFTIRRTRWR